MVAVTVHFILKTFLTRKSYLEMSKHKVQTVVLSMISTNDLKEKTQCSEYHRAYRPLSQHGPKKLTGCQLTRLLVHSCAQQKQAESGPNTGDAVLWLQCGAHK